MSSEWGCHSDAPPTRCGPRVRRAIRRGMGEGGGSGTREAEWRRGRRRGGGWGGRSHPQECEVCFCSCVFARVRLPRNPHHPLHTSSSMQSYVRTIAIVASIASVVDILIDSSLDVSICIRNHHVRTYVCSSILDASISISTTYCLRRRHHHLSSLRTYAGSPGFAICPRTHIPRTYVRTQLAAPSHDNSAKAGLRWGRACGTARRAAGQSLGVQGW